MKYARGSIVEVQIHEYVFEASHYIATVLSYSRRNGYMMRFRDLLEDDNTDLLTQYAAEEHIRPIPDPMPFHGFAVGVVVDVHTRDGWWVGRVLRPVAEMLLISFPEHHEKMVLEKSCVRLHQEFIPDGSLWMFCKN